MITLPIHVQLRFTQIYAPIVSCSCIVRNWHVHCVPLKQWRVFGIACVYTHKWFREHSFRIKSAFKNDLGLQDNLPTWTSFSLDTSQLCWQHVYSLKSSFQNTKFPKRSRTICSSFAIIEATKGGGTSSVKRFMKKKILIPYPGCQRVSMRGFRFESSLKKWPARKASGPECHPFDSVAYTKTSRIWMFCWLVPWDVECFIWWCWGNKYGTKRRHCILYSKERHISLHKRRFMSQARQTRHFDNADVVNAQTGEVYSLKKSSLATLRK